MPEKSTKERIEYLARQEQAKAVYAQLKDILQLINPEQTKNITSTTYNKENLRQYLQAPATESNQKSLRKLSDFLYSISQTYRRMINYKAEQIDCKSWIAYPILNIVEDIDTESMKQEYERVTRITHNMHLESQILKVMLQSWKHDIFYGFTYGDPETDGTFYIHPLNPDYCRIYSASYNQGCLGVAFDMSYFRSYADDLEFFDPIFKKLYNQYLSDNIRWKELPIERTLCIKINIDNLDYPIIPFSGILEDIIDLEDLQAVQSITDELSAYKLIWAKIPTISGSKEVDDFAIDLNLANDFYKKLATLIPEGVNIGLSPMDLNTLEFKSNSAAEATNTLNKAYSQLIETNGSIVLNSNKITNSESFKKAMQVECIDAMKPITQINAWVNLYLKMNYNVENWVVEYSDISPYFVEEKIKTLKEAGQYGLPVKLTYASLLNVNPVKERGLSFLENMLGLGTTDWIHPFISSNTQGSLNEDASPGAPIKDGDDLSDEGVKSRDKQ